MASTICTSKNCFPEPRSGLPTWCESPCRSKVGFGLGPQDEVDAGVTGLGSGDVLTQPCRRRARLGMRGDRSSSRSPFSPLIRPKNTAWVYLTPKQGDEPRKHESAGQRADATRRPTAMSPADR